MYFFTKQVDGKTVPFVDRVVVSAFGGTTATYQFQYTDAVIDRSTNDTDPETPTTIGRELPHRGRSA